MNKCHGCGIVLQNEDINKLGFTKNINSDLCERCFRIKHYNDYKRVIKDNETAIPRISYIYIKINKPNVATISVQ